MISILSYGMGNIGSLVNMLDHIGIRNKVISSPEEVVISDKLLLPGVGAFGKAMETMRGRGLDEAIIEATRKRAHLLGICLGMQLLTSFSEEGNAPGLNLIKAKTCSFRSLGADKIKVPHMGWNVVESSRASRRSRTILNENDERFYFVHSYYVSVDNEKHSIGKTKHGVIFDSAIQKDNIYGVQFHPEKSHKHGMCILKKFADL